MSNILVTAIGSLSADIVIKNLKKAGYIVIGSDIYDKELVANAYNVDCFYKVPYAMDKKRYVKYIVHICKENKVRYIFPLTDAEVDILNEYRKLLEEEDINVCISDYESIKRCRNKIQMYRFLKKNEVEDIIPTQLLCDADWEIIKFPVVIKPYDGRSSQGVNFIDNYEELRFFVDNNDISRYIIQPKLEGNVITVDVVRNEFLNTQVAIARKELIRTLNGAGLSVEVFKDEYLEQHTKRIAELLNINGCVNFEYIKTENGKYYLMECNPRFSGGVAFSCLAGYNCVINHLNCFMGKKIDSSIEVRDIYISRKYKEIVTKIS